MTHAPAPLRFRDAILCARRRRASDVHVQANCPPMLRVDGGLVALSEPDFTQGDVATIVDAYLADDERAALDEGGDVSVAWSDDRGRMRAHLYRSATGYAVAVRLLEPAVPSLALLGMPDAVAALAERERGLVVVAGPTGSGKSTTVAAMVDRINASRPCRILTIEDPIEYHHASRRSIVVQREIGRDTPSAAAAVRGALRADPDVIVVGEMRDPDTMRIALGAAETGHLVVTTLHSNDAAQTIDRIVDAFEGNAAIQVRAQLAAVLTGVVYQTLVARRSGGRRAAVEILVGTDAARNVIRDGKTHQLRNVMETGRRFGMQTLSQHLDELSRSGEIDARSPA